VSVLCCVTHKRTRVRDACKRELMTALTPSDARSFSDANAMREERNAKLGGAAAPDGLHLPGDTAPAFALNPVDASRAVARLGAQAAGARSAMNGKMLQYARVVTRHNETRRDRRAASASLNALASDLEPPPRAPLPLVHELGAVALACDTDDVYRRTDVHECFEIVASLAGERAASVR
jgi:hypothetical protein